jgi:cytochrome P450
MNARHDRPTVRMRWQSQINAWVTADWATCAFVCSREDLFATEHSDYPQADQIRGRRSVAVLDGRQHQQVHAVLAGFFTQRRIEDARLITIRPIIERQIAEFAIRSTAELASDYADRIPGPIIAGMLGFPTQHNELVRCYEQWSSALTRWVKTKGEDELSRATAVASAEEMTAVLRPLVVARRFQMGDDLISMLWRAGPMLLEDWSEEDILDQCRILFLAGGEGVAQLICTTAYLLLAEPHLREAVEKNRQIYLPKLIEEALRLYPPAQLRPRRATREVTVGGVRIMCGQRIYPCVQEANLDASLISNPKAIDLNRPVAKGHLAFNIGPRHCIGAGLSRIVTFEAMDALLNRLPGVTLRRELDPPELSGFRFQGFRPLHVRTR